ncbi:hypothetical protein K458DRAFT_415561 [Lentithecium fluviatile CBS 122367]|uniref:RRM domain-containing protein n=1 Tax=Lentithecium fluviatile CBS 122367 TaxID=1168545 RepID=A0A6G1JAW6_9PLEO|nr:hypothetical protein K458DRAFT_415561 [Lentithecium fluviatile CBS 122367]
MPATPATVHAQKAGPTSITATTVTSGAAQRTQEDGDKFIRLHITPFTPALLKVFLAPSVLPLAKNISYHAVETFPEKGFGYVELPEMEAQKLKKKLNGSTLKGSKVRIADAKPEKRKAAEVAEDLKENDGEPPKKRKKAKQGVLEGVELPNDRKVKRGWTEPPVKSQKEKKEKKEKGKDADKKSKRKESKYTKEPELLFKAKLTPVAAAEEARKEKSKGKKKEKKDKNKSKREVVVHEFEKNTKQPSFLKASKVSAGKKEAVEYVNGKGWVDEDGNVVEAEIGRVRNRRVLELVDPTPVQPTTEKPSVTPSPRSSPVPKSAKSKKKSKKATPPPSSSESEEDESSEVSSSSEDESSASEDEVQAADASVPSPSAQKADTPEIAVTLSSPATKEVHPLEALFKRPKPLNLSTPGSDATSTPAKGLAPINTSFSFFENNNDAMDVDTEAPDGVPATPYTQRDLEWRGLRSAAPTPDTAAIDRRFSFPWRKGSQEADDDEVDDAEAETQLSHNTKANAAAKHLPGVAEEDEEEDAEAGAEQDGDEGGEEEEKPESEFKQWFWENQGGLNRAWKKRRRDALKAKRLSDNKKAVGGGRTR